jgi:hypothetical protein
MEKMASESRNKLSIVSLVAGIIAAITLLVHFTIAGFIEASAQIPGLYIALIFTFYLLYAFILIAPIFAVTSGIISLVQLRRFGGTGRRYAIVGIILGILGFMPLMLMLSSWW